MPCATTTAATRLSSTADGDRPATIRPRGHAKLAARGAGEIFLNSIDRDGSGAGYDSDLIARVADAVDIPVVACGGVGRYEHFPAAIEAGAAAAAAANIFHFFELSYSHAKHACLRAGIPMRPVGLGSRFLAREPAYDRAAEDARIARRLADAAQGDFPAARRRRRGQAADDPLVRVVRLSVDLGGAHGVRRQRRVHRLPDGGGEGHHRAEPNGRAAASCCAT